MPVGLIFAYLTNPHAVDFVVLNSDRPAKAIRVWAADSQTRDFRKSRWAAADGALKDVLAADFGVGRPEKGYRACFAECEYLADGLTFTLSTQLRILEAQK